MDNVGEYQSLSVKKLPSRIKEASAESLYWRNFRAASTIEHIGNVTSTNFCKTSPYDFTITNSTQVLVYDGVTKKLKRTFARFRDIAYSGCLRSDGKLLAAGGETGIIQIFDANSRALLRHMKGHSRASHFVTFSSDKLHLFSTGDDKSVRWWDVSTHSCISTLSKHSDYVRCGDENISNTGLWASGSYDHTVRLWDMRMKNEIMELDHGFPLEDVKFFPSGMLLASAGGTCVKIWDVLSGRLVANLPSHQKTVTCIRFSNATSATPTERPSSPTMITGSIDCQLRFFDLEKFKSVHAVKYPEPILSMDVSSDCRTIAVGMTGGIFSIRTKKLTQKKSESDSGMDANAADKKKVKRRKEVKPLTAASFRYFIRGTNEKAAAEDFLIAQRKKACLKVHDKLLKKFLHTDALSFSLKDGSKELIIAIMEELVSRGGLKTALSKQEEMSCVSNLIKFFSRHVTDPMYASLLIPAANAFFDSKINSPLLEEPKIWNALQALRKALADQIYFQETLLTLKGALMPLTNIN